MSLESLHSGEAARHAFPVDDEIKLMGHSSILWHLDRYYELKRIQADGNCFFRSMSYWHFGDEGMFREIKQKICSRAATIMNRIMDSNDDSGYDECMMDGFWNNEEHIKATADLFNVKIVTVYLNGTRGYNELRTVVYTREGSAPTDVWFIKHVSGVHYDVYAPKSPSVERSLTLRLVQSFDTKFEKKRVDRIKYRTVLLPYRSSMRVEQVFAEAEEICGSSMAYSTKHGGEIVTARRTVGELFEEDEYELLFVSERTNDPGPWAIRPPEVARTLVLRYLKKIDVDPKSGGISLPPSPHCWEFRVPYTDSQVVGEVLEAAGRTIDKDLLYCTDERGHVIIRERTLGDVLERAGNNVLFVSDSANEAIDTMLAHLMFSLP